MRLRISFNQTKKIAAALAAGFLMFAPPGTMIGLGLLLVALTGSVWIVAAGGLLLLVIAILWFVKKRRAKN